MHRTRTVPALNRRLNELLHCPTCGTERFIYVDPQTADMEVICATCTRFAPIPDVPRPDLPPPIQFRRKSEQHIYRIIRDRGPVRPRDIHAELDRQCRDMVAYATIGHGLTRLSAAGLIRSAGRSGWELNDNTTTSDSTNPTRKENEL